MELENRSFTKEWNVLTSSEDFILSGKEAFEELLTKEEQAHRKLKWRWHFGEGNLIYPLQNILSFQFSKSKNCSLAIQALSYLSGLATLTWCYSRSLGNIIKNTLEASRIEDHVVEVFACPFDLGFEKLNFSEKQKAISYGKGKTVDYFVEDCLILETTNISTLKKVSGSVVFAPRSEEAFYHLLNLKPGIIHLALHKDMNIEKLIPLVPISVKLGVWGNIPYLQLESVFHRRWDFILPSNLSYPPWVDLFIKSS